MHHATLLHNIKSIINARRACARELLYSVCVSVPNLAVTYDVCATNCYNSERESVALPHVSVAQPCEK